MAITNETIHARIADLEKSIAYADEVLRDAELARDHAWQRRQILEGAMMVCRELLADDADTQ
jgi:hypothetical protein